MTTENIIMTMVKVQGTCQEFHEFFWPFPESNCSYKTKSDDNNFTIHVCADATQRGKREKLRARSTPLDLGARLHLNLVPHSLYLEA